MKNLARILILLTALPCFFLVGCSSYSLIEAAPEQSDPVLVEFTEGQLLGWTEVPASAYFVSDSQVVVTGQPGQVGNVPDTGRPGWATAIGVAGVAMGGGGSGGGPGGAGRIDLEGLEEAVHINLTSQANHVVRQLIATGQYANYFATSPAPSPSELSVFTTVILSYVTDTDIVPFILLKAILSDLSIESKIWEARYFASSGESLPMVGESSWVELGAEGTERVLIPHLKRAIEFMLSDISSPRVRDDGRLYMVQGRFPYMQQRLQTVGYKLDEDNQAIYFAPKIPDSMAFSGIHVLDKSVTIYREAAKGDVGIAGFKILKEED